jgi:hypothetical protein
MEKKSIDKKGMSCFWQSAKLAKDWCPLFFANGILVGPPTPAVRVDFPSQARAIGLPFFRTEQFFAPNTCSPFFPILFFVKMLFKKVMDGNPKWLL